jgi:hypothetical protein
MRSLTAGFAWFDSPLRSPCSRDRFQPDRLGHAGGPTSAPIDRLVRGPGQRDAGPVPPHVGSDVESNAVCSLASTLSYLMGLQQRSFEAFCCPSPLSVSTVCSPGRLGL